MSQLNNARSKTQVRTAGTYKTRSEYQTNDPKIDKMEYIRDDRGDLQFGEIGFPIGVLILQDNAMQSFRVIHIQRSLLRTGV